MKQRPTVPSMGPDPVLISRKEIDALYDILEAVIAALNQLGVEYIVTGGSLLGAIRQHSILFCDDDIDIAIIDDKEGRQYNKVAQNLGRILGNEFKYSIRPWEGGDKVRVKRMSSVFLDIFCLRQYDTMEEFIEVIGVKKNGESQGDEYIETITRKIQESACSRETKNDELFPFWHFNTRKAIELWPKEVYRPNELFPLSRDLKFGRLENICGPRMPVLLLKRAFGSDCFHVYYQSGSHKELKAKGSEAKTINSNGNSEGSDQSSKKNQFEKELQPIVLQGGNWEHSEKATLNDEHYIPTQVISRAKRRPTMHNKQQLFNYLEEQGNLELSWLHNNEDQSLQTECKESIGANDIIHNNDITNDRPNCTVYMDGVFDLFHIGHLEALHQCAKLGNRVIIGITGDADASGYKRPPIIKQSERVAIVEAIREVDLTVCPCPLIVTEEFMNEHGIDLVVHGFANDEDAKRQEEFFEIPMRNGKFKRIPYYEGLSTTDIINKIKDL